MAGPLQAVDTQVDAIGLDVDRRLTLGDNCQLVFWAKDGTQIGGVREVKRLDNIAFNRVASEEGERATGQDIVFAVADLDGDMAQTVETADFVQLVVDGVDGPYLVMNDAPKPAEGQSQVYVITCQRPKLKRTYL